MEPSMAQALLKGGIGTFSLGELLQATSLGRQSMMVEVIDRKGKVLGHVRLKGGMVVWAETRKTTGREAFAALLKDPKAHTFIASAISDDSTSKPVGTLQDLLPAPPPDAERAAIKQSWTKVAPILDTAVDLFYGRLFELRPDLRPMFPSDMTEQKKKLGATLAFVVGALDWPQRDWARPQDPKSDLFLAVLALGQRHRSSYAVKDEHYGPVGEALLWTLERGLGEAFDAPTRDAWTHAYGLLSTTMKLSASVVAERSVA